MGLAAQRQAGAEAPQWIQVDGKPFPLREGRVFLYFFDPECSHCDAAARKIIPILPADDSAEMISLYVSEAKIQMRSVRGSIG